VACFAAEDLWLGHWFGVPKIGHGLIHCFTHVGHVDETNLCKSTGVEN